MRPKLIIKTIKSATGDRVTVTAESLNHSIRHFNIPEDLFLELLERVLVHPTAVFEELHPPIAVFHLFYRLEGLGYVVAVVKVKVDGCFLVTVYPTKKKIRPKHAKLKRLKP